MKGIRIKQQVCCSLLIGFSAIFTPFFFDMKKFLFYILAISMGLSACTQRQYAFRKKVTIGKEMAKVSVRDIRKEQPTPALWVAAMSPRILIKQPEAPRVLPVQQLAKPIMPPVAQPSFAPHDTVHKKYKFDDPKSQRGYKLSLRNPEYNTHAILGFVFGVLSVISLPLAIAIFGLLFGVLAFVLLPLCVPGYLLSVKGLHSEYRILAYIGYGLSLMMMAVLLFLLSLLLFLLVVMLFGGVSTP